MSDDLDGICDVQRYTESIFLDSGASVFAPFVFDRPILKENFVLT